MNRDQGRRWAPRGPANRGGRGRGRGDAPHSQPPRSAHQPGGAINGASVNEFCGNKEGVSIGETGSSQDVFPCSSSKYNKHKPTWSSEHQKVWRPSERKDPVLCAEGLKEGHNSTEPVKFNPKGTISPVAANSDRKGDISQSSLTFDLSRNLHKRVEGMQIGEKSWKNMGNIGNSVPSISAPIDEPILTDSKPELSENKSADPPFDLCPSKAGGPVKLNTSLLVKNRERRNELKCSMEQQSEILQPGLILLKNYISLSDQIMIVKLCRDLGLGPGGFYQPGYRDGAKLNLKMMCLGKNWDPESSKYGDHRPHDGAKPPCIPGELFHFVEKALKESHSLIKKTTKASKSEDVLPTMTPDICIVNFYSSTGRLGLHQDRDESDQSLKRGLPVVSFSIGDAAEFLYGDQRDVELAKRITLKSGDVLIFGGKSRHIFHGVESIQPNTAPTTLRDETNLSPGRLNLTFREY